LYRDVNQLLQLRQGEQEAAGLGEGPGGLHAGQQLEEDEEAAAAQKESFPAVCQTSRWCQAAAEEKAETMKDFLIIFLPKYIFYICSLKESVTI
jgi:hypothetical protein